MIMTREEHRNFTETGRIGNDKRRENKRLGKEDI